VNPSPPLEQVGTDKTSAAGYEDFHFFCALLLTHESNRMTAKQIPATKTTRETKPRT
jgi:hypothetical protein